MLEKAYTEAVKSLKKALSLTGMNTTILYNLMIAYYQSKNYDMAINIGKEILGLENLESSMAAKVYNLIGQIYNDRKDYKNAVAIIKEAIEKGVNNCDSYSVAAFASYKLGNVNESTSWSKKMEECEKNQ